MFMEKIIIYEERHHYEMGLRLIGSYVGRIVVGLMLES